MKGLTGAEVICRALVSAGVDTVFGLPGTQNVELFEALRRSEVKTVVASHELGAAFMANGYARATGRPGVLFTIPGPGFTYALTGLAEARLDSVPLLHILPGPAHRASVGFPLQALDQAAMAAPACKLVLRASRWPDLAHTVAVAHGLADADEPGPVLVEIEPHLLTEVGNEADQVAPEPSPDRGLRLEPVREIASMLRESRRRVLYVGQGASFAAERVGTLSERLGAPVITTTSGRSSKGISWMRANVSRMRSCRGVTVTESPCLRVSSRCSHTS
jgi:acetolactate synthase-1/2/3 large subunit